MSPLPGDDRELHEFVGETRARLQTLEGGQRDLWNAVTDSRRDAATANATLTSTVAKLANEIAGMKVKLAVAAGVASMAGAAIAGLLVKYA